MSPKNFDGQVVIVTGGGGGLGAAFCKELARRGAAVVVNEIANTPDGESYADAVVHDILSGGGRAIPNYDTVATEAGGRAIVESALHAFGRIDAVISNAGNQRNGRFGEITAEDIVAVFAVHTYGAFFVGQPAYREMIKQGYGRLVLVSSQSGAFGNPFRSNYGAAKTALIGLMNVIAQEAPPTIKVNCLFPNAYGGRLGSTPIEQRIDRAFLEAAAEQNKTYRHALKPEFIAPLACYLASRDCNASQGMYSAAGGKYSRIFIGLTEGWYSAGADAPSCEDLVKNLAKIDDRSRYDVPLSGFEEYETVLATRRRLGLD